MGNLWAGVRGGGYLISPCREGEFGKLRGQEPRPVASGLCLVRLGGVGGRILGELSLRRQNGIKWRYFGT